ncbi:MAG: preprotein translocase subunit SecG [Chloroflexaceae bacterium]|nr:preprotein translocase subunit SecG [Chloroflexaceae bacterium]NJO06515.1 preprotein translocase subunit SecG [Chloroflexaceae bacterium]
MEAALHVTLIILSVLMTVLVIVQVRGQGLSNRDSSSVYHTKRGLEKTMHQTTIVISVIFLLLSLIASLPLFGTGTLAL